MSIKTAQDKIRKRKEEGEESSSYQPSQDQNKGKNRTQKDRQIRTGGVNQPVRMPEWQRQAPEQQSIYTGDFDKDRETFLRYNPSYGYNGNLEHDREYAKWAQQNAIQQPTRQDAMTNNRAIWEQEAQKLQARQSSRNSGTWFAKMANFGATPDEERDIQEWRDYYHAMEQAGRLYGDPDALTKGKEGFAEYTGRLNELDRAREEELAAARGRAMQVIPNYSGSTAGEIPHVTVKDDDGNVVYDKVMPELHRYSAMEEVTEKEAKAYERMYRNAAAVGDLERAAYAAGMYNNSIRSARGYTEDAGKRYADLDSGTAQERLDRAMEALQFAGMTGNDELTGRAQKALTKADKDLQEEQYQKDLETLKSSNPDQYYAATRNKYQLEADLNKAKDREEELRKKAVKIREDLEYDFYEVKGNSPRIQLPEEDKQKIMSAQADYEIAQNDAAALQSAIQIREQVDQAEFLKSVSDARSGSGYADRVEMGKQKALQLHHDQYAVDNYLDGLSQEEKNDYFYLMANYNSTGGGDAAAYRDLVMKKHEDEKWATLANGIQNGGYVGQAIGWAFGTLARIGGGVSGLLENATDLSLGLVFRPGETVKNFVTHPITAPVKTVFGGGNGRNSALLTKAGNTMVSAAAENARKEGLAITGGLWKGGSAAFATELSSSMAESALGAGLAKGAAARGLSRLAKILPYLSTASMGSAAATADYLEMKEAGWSEEAARAHATCAGLWEFAFEEVSLDHLINTTALVGGTRWQQLVHTLKESAKQAGVEMSEEMFTTLANTISDSAIAAKYGYDDSIERARKEYMAQGFSAEEASKKAKEEWGTQLLMDCLGGLLSGGTMAFVGSGGLSTTVGAAVEGMQNVGRYVGGKISDTASNVKGLFTQDFGDWLTDTPQLHQKASESTVNRAVNDQSGGIRNAMQAYAEKNGITLKETKGEIAATSAETGSDSKEKVGRRTTKALRTNVEAVTNSIADQMYSKSETVDGRMEGAVAVYNETVQEYGEGIKPVAQAALRNTVNKIVTETSAKGNVTATTAYQAQVDAIQDPEAKQIAQAALDRAVTSKAAQATQNSERMEGLRHLTEKRHTPVKLEAIVTGTDGKETTTGIKGFSSDGSSVVLDNGAEVKVEELQTTDSDVKDAIDAIHAAKLGGLANVVFQSYLAADLSHSAKDSYRWIAGYVGAINQGITHSITVQQAVEQNARMFGLDEETVRQAYVLGETLRNDPKVQARKQGLQKAVELAKEKGVKGRKAKIDTSRIQGIKISGELQAHITAVNRIAKAVGVDIVWFSSKNADGSYSAMSGKHADGTIWLDIESGKNSAGDVAIAILGTMSHELTHFIQQYSNDLYMELQDLAMQHLRQQLGEDGLEQLILDTVKKNDFTGDNAKVKAMEELTAQFCEKMFSMEESMQPVLADVQQNHKGLWAKIKEFFQGFIEKVRKLIEQGETAQKSEALQVWENITEEMQKVFAAKWGEALRSAKQTHDAVTSLEAAGIQVEGIKNTAQEGGEQHMDRSYAEQEDGGLITSSMTEQERETILRKKASFSPAEYEGQADKVITKLRGDLESQKKDLIRAAWISAAQDLDLPRSIYNDDMRMNLEVSFGTLRETASKKISDTETIVKLIPVLKKAAQNAIGIEIHDNRYFADTNTLLFASMLGGYIDGDYFIPVRFGVKIDRQGNNNLYVLICDEKIKKAEVTIAPGRKTSSQNTTRSASEISIALLSKVVKHEDIIKYLPDGLLTEDQRARKWQAIANTVAYTNDKNDRKYKKFLADGNKQSVAQMVMAAAKANGYTIRAQHGSFAEKRFTVFEPGERGEMWFGSPGTAYQRPQMYDTYLKINNPYEVTYTVGADTKFDPQDVVEKGKQNGHDGGIVHFQLDSEMVKKNLPIIEKLFPDMLATSDFVKSFRFMPQGDLLNTLARPGETLVEFMKRGMEGDLYQWYTVYKPSQIKSADPVTYDDAGNVIPLSERFNTENEDIRYQTRPTDTVSDVDLLLQQKVEDATNREQGRLLKEFQAKARQVQELEAKLEQAKAQLKRTDRSYNTRGIQKLIGDTMKTFGMGDAKNVGIRKTAAEMLNKAYDKAIAAIDRGDSAGALDEVYQGAVAVAEYLLDNGTYREKQGFHWDRAQWAQVYANTEEARQHAIDEVVSTVYIDFASNRYREAVQATAVDRIVDRVEAKYNEKLDAAKAQNKALQETNEKLEQDRDFFREVSDQTKDIANNLYTELKETREELKEAKRTNSKDTKRLQQKADKLAQDLKKANQQAKDWRDKAQHLGTFAQQLVASKNLDIQGLRQELAAAHEKLQAAASQIEEMKGWEEKAKHAGAYSQQLIDSKNRDIAKLEKEIQKHRDILAGKLRNPQLTAMLKNAREAVYKERNQRIQDIRDQRKRTELRKRIVNLKEDLQRRLSKPTDGRYVPAGLAKSLIDVLDTVDNSPQAGTKAAERAVTVSERLRALADAYESIKDDPNIGWEYQSEYDEDIRNQIKALSETMQGRNLRDLSSEDLQQVYDQVRQVRDIIRDAAKTMSGIEFGSLYDAMYSVANQQQSLKSLNNLGWYGRNKRMRILDNLSVMRAVEMMSGWDRSSALYQLMHAVENGADESWRWMMEYNKSLQELKTGKNEKAYRDALTKKIDFGVTDEEGEKVLMTKLQALQILMTAEREAANHDLVHLQKGGAVIRDALAIQDGKANKAKSQTIKVTPELLQDIRDSLTEWDRSYMEAIHKYFAKEAKATNDVLYRLKHRVLQAEDAYVPYIVDQNYLDAKLDEQGAMTMWVRSPGSTNALKIQSPKPVIIDGMDTVMAKHVREIADYIGMAIPIRDFSKVYNGRLQSRDSNPFPVKKAIDRTFGSKGQHLLTQAIVDVQGGSNSSSWSTYIAEHLNKLQGAFVRSALLINPSVTIKQAASYIAAESILSHLALERGNHPIWTKTDESNAFMPGGLIHHIFWLPSGSTATRLYNEIDQYTSLHYQRRLGMSQAEVANEANRSGKLKRAVNSVGARMEQNAFGHAVRKAGEALDPVTWIQRMDVATTAALWVACKEQAKLDGKQVGSTEYWQRTTELYERCLRETQPMYDGLHRSANQKQHEGIMQYLFPFRTVPIQNHGQMAASYEALLAARASGDKAKIKEANRFFAKTMWAQFESAVVFASMTFLAAAMKRKTKKYLDEDEELTVESVLKGIGLDVAGTMVSNFNPLLGSAIWDTVGNIYDSVKTGKKIWSYDSFSIGPVDLLNEGMKAYGNLATDLLAVIGGKDVSWDTVKGHLNTAAVKSLKFIGLPSDTVKTYVEGTIGNLQDAFEGRVPALNDESWVRSTSTDARRFIKALEAGNTFKAGNVLAGMKKNIRDANPRIKEDKLNSRVQNAINSYIHEQILSGGIKEDKAISYMVQYGGKTENDAYWAIQEWRAKELHKGEEDYSWSPYEGLREDIDMGEKWENIKKSSLLELTEHGKDVSDIYQAITEHIHKRFDAGELTEDETMEMMQAYSWKKDDKTKQYRRFTASEAYFKLEEWKAKAADPEDSSWSQYDAMRDALRAGGDGAEELQDLLDHDVSEASAYEEYGKAVKNLLTDGTISSAEAQQLLLDNWKVKDSETKEYRKPTENEVWKQTKRWAETAEHEGELDYSYSQYDTVDEAISAGKDISGLVKELTDHGIKQEDVNSHIKTYLVNQYVEGKTNEMGLKNQLSHYLGLAGGEDRDEIVRDANCKKLTGYDYGNLGKGYKAGKITSADVKKALTQYGGMSSAEATTRVRYYDFQKAFPDSQLGQSTIDKYYDTRVENVGKTLKDASISMDTYVRYAEAASKAKGTDKDGDGKTDSGSKKAAIMQIIDGLSLTPQQKDALYYFNGWAASKIREAPWH